MGKKVTAVLIKYKRLTELETIIQDFREYDFIDEILVRDNTKENHIMYGRYEMIKQAKNETVYIQDDDCVVFNIGELYNRFDGSCLVNNMKAERMPFYKGKDTLVGWGTILKREWVNCFDKYIEKHGIDSVLYREADRIFTSLIEVPKLTIEARVQDFPSAMGREALSLQEEHEYSRQIALKRCEVIYDEQKVKV